MTNKQPEYSVDIVIPTRNRGDLILITVSSLLSNTYTDFRLWIVDQSDTPSTKEALEAYLAKDPRVRYCHVETPGSSRARSIGATLGEAPYILYTDDDCRVAKNWIGEMVEELSHSETWAVFGRVIEDETYAPPIPSGSTPVNTNGIKMALKDDKTRRAFSGNRLNLGFGHGANMGINRQRLKDIGGFDIFLGAGGLFKSWPERDLGYRILKKGGKIIYTPKALVYHRHWRGWEDVKKTNKNYAYGAGAAISKYWRAGDATGALYLFFEWVLDQGARQVLSGLLRWRSMQKIQIGINHMIYPWHGLIDSLKYEVDIENITYAPLPHSNSFKKTNGS